ncbi:hypothetical_protein [Leishmania infantum]|uniref:Uncharacterized protein n=2 Tax=Leishmania donovani species complex TaxID=38574 RepID=A0A3Q8IDM4_LEIDO|nr:hypothetical protein LdCL_260010600 [Leishmania donovani]CAC9496039.1 hypothetical_protein [Leishmania infantum]SUZ42643.1 hypothetical_protein [Leishmania infantum]
MHGITKRMALLVFLLAANLGVLYLTVYVNTSSFVNFSEEMKVLAVRMQLPSPVLLFFAPSLSSTPFWRPPPPRS